MACEGDKRSAFLAQACGGDARLRAELESLIAIHEQERDFLARPIIPGAARLVVDAHSETVNARIGPYEIIREIGQGGMGTVYLGVRSDDFHKWVAIKVVKRGMDSEEIVRRFQKERQILANLDHSNIAKLLDGGTTKDGLPYFVMEYIAGRPIHEYCDSHHLSVTRRLKLFLAVCAGIQYAHQNLVVHRDIKPGNILVTDEGVPKLLDFGIAKLLNAEFPEATIAPTSAIFPPMTPEYASPEQVRGEAISVASDVYSLGVLLYQLLTGDRPYQIQSRRPGDILQAVCEQQPEKPSLVAPDRLRRRLSGDLDNIVMMALRKEAQRRYSSVEQFAEDIRRHLAGRPVIARKDTFTYRTAKFIGRNRLPLAAGLLLFISLCSVVAAVTIQSTRVARERDRAERVSAFLTGMFEAFEPNRAQSSIVTSQDILDRGAARIAGELNDQPEVQAKLMETIGAVYLRQGLYAKAQPLLENALAINRRLFGNEHQEVAASLNLLGMLFMEKGDYARAEPMFTDALAINRGQLGNKDLRVAANLNNLGVLALHKGAYQRAASYYREALAIRREQLGHNHPDVAKTMNNLSGALREMGELAEAAQLSREAIAIYRRSLGKDGMSTSMAIAINNLATVQMELGDYDSAEALFREGLAIKQQLWGKEHFEIARSLNGLGMLYYEKGDYGRAQSLLQEAGGMFERLLGEHQYTAIAKKNLARVREADNDYQGAERLYREALAMSERLLGERHPTSISILTHLATLLARQRDDAAAELLLRRALALGREALPPNHMTVATALLELGCLLVRRGQAAQAVPLLEGALVIRRKRLPTGHRLIADAEIALSGACATFNKPAK